MQKERKVQNQTNDKIKSVSSFRFWNALFHVKVLFTNLERAGAVIGRWWRADSFFTRTGEQVGEQFWPWHCGGAAAMAPFHFETSKNISSLVHSWVCTKELKSTFLSNSFWNLDNNRCVVHSWVCTKELKSAFLSNYEKDVTAINSNTIRICNS